MPYIEFLPFLPVEQTFEYICDFEVEIGDVVRCRFGAFDTLGTILAVHSVQQTQHKLSLVKEVIFREVYSRPMLDLVGYLAKYYGHNTGMFAKLAFPFSVKDSAFQTQEQIVRLTQDAKYESSKAQKWKEVFNTLCKTNGVPSLVFTGLGQFKNRGLLEFFTQPIIIENKQSEKILHANIPPLSQEQECVCNNILSYNGFAVSLIFGKTGSGKTEVYIHLMLNIIRKNPSAQVLLMLPEIGLAKVIAQRLEVRFGTPIPVWNSAIAEGVRKKQYQEIVAGGYNIIVGTRSSLFLPYKNLQMIIVDEEHDFSYKQEETPVYNARDCAVLYGKMLGISVVLGSATPSMESFYNTQIEKYQLHELQTRFNAVLMPKIEIIKEKTRKILCESVRAQIVKYFNEGKQVLIFLNRRGFAPINECRACKSSFRCDSCDSFLTYHKKKGVLMCHKCGANYAIYAGCYMCGEELTVVSSGSGVEAVHEEVVELLGVKNGIAIFSSDEQNTEKKLGNFISCVQSGEVKVIIGTQIASKGYDFPNLKLVCVVDLILKNDDIDFKADEKLMQLLVQVAGRSGRAGEQGLVLIQSKRNEDVLRKMLHTETFYPNEIITRKNNFLPPFSRFIAIIFSAKNEKFLIAEAGRVTEEIKRQVSATVLGPAPSSIAFTKNIYRYRVLIIAKKSDNNLQQKLKNILAKAKCKTKLDVDAINFY